MQLGGTPWHSGRYWVAIILASCCGTNLGDLLPDVFKLSPLEQVAIWLPLLAVSGAAAVLSKEREPWFWFAILVFCGAATGLADMAVDDAQLSRLETCAILLALLGALLMLRRTMGLPAPQRYATDTIFWLCFLSVGMLGTVLADGLGQAFHTVKIGVPVSALMATLVLLVAVGTVARRSQPIGAIFWLAIFASRWWGTNVGDIVKFLTTMEISIGLSAGLLLLVLLAWRARSDHDGTAEVMAS